MKKSKSDMLFSFLSIGLLAILIMTELAFGGIAMTKTRERAQLVSENTLEASPVIAGNGENIGGGGMPNANGGLGNGGAGANGGLGNGGAGANGEIGDGWNNFDGGNGADGGRSASDNNGNSGTEGGDDASSAWGWIIAIAIGIVVVAIVISLTTKKRKPNNR